jgi:hypothetical protein
MTRLPKWAGCAVKATSHTSEKNMHFVSCLNFDRFSLPELYVCHYP